ncbi:type II secretion system F family protein [Lachnoclostridium phytofermentans]|nr:type II secretion system F family protein [Lachnoclostridium phytofermentans]
MAEDRKKKLNTEFLDGIHSLSVALEAGYSVENAFKAAIKDLGLMYSKEALIMKEFQCIVSQINHNIPIENAIGEFANRSKLEDVECFSEVFKTAKRTGGDLVAIIKMTGKTIGEKVEVMREIETLITAKKMEANIMKLVPFGILGYMLLGSPQFLKPLYHNLFGIIFMTILLGIYLFLTKLVDKIIAIRV